MFWEKTLELTVDDLCKKTEKIAGEEGSRLIVKSHRLRLVPKKLLETAQSHFKYAQDIRETMLYILSGFRVYRASVNSQSLAPHYFNDGAYEWPEPAKFSWGDRNAVIALGDYLQAGVKEGQVKIATVKGARVHEIIIEDKESGFERNVVERPVDPMRDTLDSQLKFKVPTLANVGFLPSFEWQRFSLGAYANPIYFMLRDLSSHRLTEDECEEYLEDHFDSLEQKYNALMGLIKRFPWQWSNANIKQWMYGAISSRNQI